MLVVLPLAGNLFPRWISFLVAMRYYAGNWPYGVWLFRGESYRKLARLRPAHRGFTINSRGSTIGRLASRWWGK